MRTAPMIALVLDTSLGLQPVSAGDEQSKRTAQQRGFTNEYLSMLGYSDAWHRRF